jgi:hypothetical protein
MILFLGQEDNPKIHYFCTRSEQENLERIGLGSAFTLDTAEVQCVYWFPGKCASEIMGDLGPVSMSSNWLKSQLSMICSGEAGCPEGVVDEQGFVGCNAFSGGQFCDVGKEERGGGGAAYAPLLCEA